MTLSFLLIPNITNSYSNIVYVHPVRYKPPRAPLGFTDLLGYRHGLKGGAKTISLIQNCHKTCRLSQNKCQISCITNILKQIFTMAQTPNLSNQFQFRKRIKNQVLFSFQGLIHYSLIGILGANNTEPLDIRTNVGPVKKGDVYFDPQPLD